MSNRRRNRRKETARPTHLNLTAGVFEIVVEDGVVEGVRTRKGCFRPIPFPTFVVHEYDSDGIFPGARNGVDERGRKFHVYNVGELVGGRS